MALAPPDDAPAHALDAAPPLCVAYSASCPLAPRLDALQLPAVIAVRRCAASWPRAQSELWTALQSAAAASASPPPPLDEPLVFLLDGTLLGAGAAALDAVLMQRGLPPIPIPPPPTAAAASPPPAAVGMLRTLRALRGGARALIIVDVQADFCAGGALPVPDGDAVVPVINALRADCAWDAVLLTQDWHPPDHASFAANNAGAALFSTRAAAGVAAQVMWPAHCVQGSAGADFHARLARGAGDIVVRKGAHAAVDSYSGFGDALGHRVERTELGAALRARGVSDVFVVGLALDFCVAFTCKDAALAGYGVACVLDAARAISPEGAQREAAAMAALGVRLLRAVDVPTAAFERALAGARVDVRAWLLCDDAAAADAAAV